MPKTKFQGIIFGLLMSLTMAYGMEVYNVALKAGGLAVMTNRVFLEALLETAYMWILVFLFSNLWGNRLGFRLAKIGRWQLEPAAGLLGGHGAEKLSHGLALESVRRRSFLPTGVSAAFCQAVSLLLICLPYQKAPAHFKNAPALLFQMMAVPLAQGSNFSA